MAEMAGPVERVDVEVRVTRAEEGSDCILREALGSREGRGVPCQRGKCNGGGFEAVLLRKINGRDRVRRFTGF